ncbi:MAG TPA: formimidoylglutamate deiminase [Solirubrobacteraceae bacterium]|jgi:formiminoglutamate deiminase
MKLWCRHAWLGGPALSRGVLLEVADGWIAAVSSDVTPPADAERLDGLVLPGLANAHSHAFQRALRGTTHGDFGSFWTWRRQMYQLAGRLDPDSMLAIARAAFAEMALAGITLVGEFHYVHHGPGGVPYADSNAMGGAVIEAAAQAGLRLTLLDACYLDGGIEPDPVQERFFDTDVEAWSTRVTALQAGPAVRLGAAIHSMRAVPPESAAQVARWAAEDARPVHAHVSEQPAENEACLEVYGATPTGLLHFEGALSERFTAVHATHLTDADVSLLSQARVSCCLCPTTERDLADGIGPARRLHESGCRLTIGTDSNALIDPWEEMRAIELDERLASGSRGGLDGATLLRSGTASGYESLGWPEGGRIAEGALADLVCLDLTGVRLAGCSAEDLVDAAVFAAASGDVRHVLVGGRFVVRDGRHVSLDVAGELDSAVGALRR